MAEETPNTPAAPKPSGLPPKSPLPPTAAGAPPKAPLPPGVGGPAKAPPPPSPVPGAPKMAAAPPAPGAPTLAKPAAPAPAAAIKKDEVAKVEPAKSVSRREFLNYVWGASMALFLAEFGGLAFFFALPRPRPGEFGGIVASNVEFFQESLDKKIPVAINEGKYWAVQTEAGINALYKVCTHLGCIYPWSEAAGIFACPCHGSQFQLNGDWIAGPAPRSLDRFEFEIVDADGKVLATSTAKGEAVPLPPGATAIKVNTGKKIEGKSHL